MRMMRTKAEGARILKKFTLSYLVLLLIPLTMSIGAYLFTQHVLRGQIEGRNETLIASSLERIENSLAEAQSFATTLNQQESLYKLLRQSKNADATPVYDIYLMQGQIPSFNDHNGLIGEYFVVDAHMRFLLAYKHAYINLAQHYADQLAVEGMSYETWRERVLSMANPAGTLPALRHLGQDGKRKASIPYFLPYYDQQRGGLLGKIVFFLDVEKMRALIQPAFDIGVQYIYVFDAQGTLLLAYDAADVLTVEADQAAIERTLADTGRYVINTKTSRKSGWRIYTAVPKTAITGQLSSVLGVLLIGMLALLAVGVALTILILHSHRRPLSQIVKQLPLADVPKNTPNNPLWHVSEAILTLTHDRERLQARLEEQREQLKLASLSRLVSGGLTDELEIESLLRHAGLDLAGDVHRGIYLKVNEPTERDGPALAQSDYLRSLVLEALPPFAQALKYLMLHDQHVIVLLYSQPEEAPEGRAEGVTAAGDPFAATMAAFYKILKGSYGMDAVFFAGPACTTLKDLSRSFEEARRLMEMAGDTVETHYLVTYDEGAYNGEHYFYSPGEEHRLISLAEKGKYEEIDGLLEAIYARNFVNTHLSRFWTQLLYARMIQTLADSPHYQVNQQAFAEVLMTLDQRAFFQELRHQYQGWCEAALLRMQQSQNQLIQNTRLYIEQNYQDSGIGLAGAALHLGVTETHLSSFFKAKTGRSFSSCLEALRIAKACELLSNSQLTVEEIAERVGYANVHSFRRAYRRVMGYTPSQHRERTNQS